MTRKSSTWTTCLWNWSFYRTPSRRRCMIRAVAAALAVSLCLTGCVAGKKSPEPGQVLSAVSKEDCLLCGDGAGEDFAWGQDNIGIFSLNTFAVMPIDINRYDREGKLEEKNTGTLDMRGNTEKETGFSARLTVDADRGMAMGDCAFGEDETLKAEKAAGALCQSCLDRAVAADGTGVGVIDFATREFWPLRRATAGFGIGNYYVHCDWDSSEPGARLWVFYTPLRYPKE